jgi:hypothetical protein
MNANDKKVKEIIDTIKGAIIRSKTAFVDMQRIVMPYESWLKRDNIYEMSSGELASLQDLKKEVESNTNLVLVMLQKLKNSASSAQNGIPILLREEINDLTQSTLDYTEALNITFRNQRWICKKQARNCGQWLVQEAYKSFRKTIEAVLNSIAKIAKTDDMHIVNYPEAVEFIVLGELEEIPSTLHKIRWQAK